MKEVVSLSDIPKRSHFVIIQMATVNVPASNASSPPFNPGMIHPPVQPTMEMKYVLMRVTTDEQEWRDEIAEELSRDPEQNGFIAYYSEGPAKITVATQIKINYKSF